MEDARGNEQTCPECGRRGKTVTATTVRLFVKPASLASCLDYEGFRFCTTPDCDVVYFRVEADGQATRFLKQHVTVRVGTKETSGERPICYCFGFDAADILADAADGAPTIPERIREKCSQGLDRCHVTNPRGVCCLGDVRALARPQAGGKKASDDCC